jgi:DUF971 family protein
MKKPKKINKIEGMLEITWDDSTSDKIEITKLRDLCPCASCQGETILFTTYKPEPEPDKPGKYELKNITMVGNYAIQIIWADGHDSGIYSWEYLETIIHK